MAPLSNYRSPAAARLPTISRVEIIDAGGREESQRKLLRGSLA